ncbi:MAG: helix-turn-helix domain-containing protein [Terriglobia bacterium]
MSVRQIHRCVVCELHYAPIVVLGLARVVRVAHDVLTTRRLLTKIAQARGYRDLAGMDRQFRKFVGISPGGYRASRGPSTSETAK